MGRYLVVENTENNSKSISYLMASIIRDFVGNENFDGDWHLSKKNVSCCIMAAKLLLDSEDKLQFYIEKHKENYWAGVSTIDEIKKHLQWIIICFADNLAAAICDEKDFLVVWWDG